VTGILVNVDVGQGDVAIGRLDVKPVLQDGAIVAACEEVNLVPAPREETTVIAAKCSKSNNSVAEVTRLRR
jgi:hypothetical protein